MSKNDIITELYNSPFINEVVSNITKGHHLQYDLKSELFLILCEMSEKKIIKAYQEKWINYLCITILKNQFWSGTSAFHKKWRKNREEIPEHLDHIDVPDEDTERNWDLIAKIEWIVENKLDIVDRELFKMYYKMDRYDRWIGDLRDKKCEKPTSSYRKMEQKLALKGEPRITIGRGMISLSHQRVIMIIQKELEKYNREI